MAKDSSDFNFSMQNTFLVGKGLLLLGKMFGNISTRKSLQFFQCLAVSLPSDRLSLQQLQCLALQKILTLKLKI